MSELFCDDIWKDDPTPAPVQNGWQEFRLRETCHHEGSHTVAAHQLGIALSMVSVEPGKGSLGHTELSNRASAFNPKDMGLAEIEEWVRKHGIVCLAGAAGSLMFGGTEDWNGASEDLLVLDSILRIVAPLQAQRKLKKDILWDETEEIIRRDWALVKAVAAALQKDKTLNSKQVSEVIGRAKRRNEGKVKSG